MELHDVTLPSLPVARMVGHEGPIQDVRFTADGNHCLTAGHDRTVRLWNPLRKDPACTLPITSRSESDDVSLDNIPHALPIQVYSQGYAYPVSAVSIDDKSTTLAAASDKTLIITDIISSKIKQRFHGHVGRINAVSISEKCDTYLSASYDGQCRIWDGRSRNPNPIQILNEAKDSVTDVHVVQSGTKSLIRTSSVDGFVRTYDIRMGQVKCDDCGNSITSICQTHDGQCLAISCLDGTIRLMEQDSGELLNTYVSHQAGNYSLQCAITADDAHVVTGSEDGKVFFYNLVDAKVVQFLEGHTKATCSIATHPKREKTSVLITGSYDGSAVVWANDSSVVRWQD